MSGGNKYKQKILFIKPRELLKKNEFNHLSDINETIKPT